MDDHIEILFRAAINKDERVHVLDAPKQDFGSKDERNITPQGGRTQVIHRITPTKRILPIVCRL